MIKPRQSALALLSFLALGTGWASILYVQASNWQTEVGFAGYFALSSLPALAASLMLLAIAKLSSRTWVRLLTLPVLAFAVLVIWLLPEAVIVRHVIGGQSWASLDSTKLGNLALQIGASTRVFLWPFLIVGLLFFWLVGSGAKK